jgi:hypothetical protein
MAIFIMPVASECNASTEVNFVELLRSFVAQVANAVAMSPTAIMKTKASTNTAPRSGSRGATRVH